MVSLVQFSGNQLVVATVQDADLSRTVATVYQPKLDSYIAAIADYVEKWTDSSLKAVEARKMDYDLWRATKNAISPYISTLNVINDNVARSFKQQDQIDKLRSGIKDVTTKTIPEQSVSVWDVLGVSKSTPMDMLLVPLNALKQAALAVKNEIYSVGGKIVDRASGSATAVAVSAGGKLVLDRYSSDPEFKKSMDALGTGAGKSGVDYLLNVYLKTPEGQEMLKKLINDSGTKRLITVLTVGSAVVLGSLAIWLLTRKR